jgi:hypothetical protein
LLITLGAWVCGGGTAAAEHGNPWLVVFPDPSEGLATNGRIILFSENGPDERVVMPGRYAYRLVADDHEIALATRRLRRGDDWNGYGRSHITLEPVRRLRAQTRYRLETRYRNRAWDTVYVAAPMRGPNATYGGPSGVAEWTTTARADRAPPRIVEQPTPVRDPSDPASHRLRVVVDDENAVSLVVRQGGPDVFAHRTYHQEVFGVHEGCVRLFVAAGTRIDVTAEDAVGNRADALPVRLTGHGESNELVICLARGADGQGIE